MNLFLQTRKLTQSKEDHLTEFFAALLEMDPDFRAFYETLVLKDYALSKCWGSFEIVKVETQEAYPEANCRPDMRLTLKEGQVILCENKIEADETMGPPLYERAQLERYLSLPVHGVVYTRSSWKPPDPDIITDPKYIKPAAREHFLWRDFYPSLAESRGEFQGWLREGFEYLGFTPPIPILGDLNDPDKKLRRERRQNFAKLWTSTKTLARSFGWKVTTGSIAELYLKKEDRSKVHRIFISPIKTERFLIRVVPGSASESDMLLSEFNRAVENLGIAGIEIMKVPRTKNIDIKSSLRNILSCNAESTEEIEKELCLFLGSFLQAIKIAESVQFKKINRPEAK